MDRETLEELEILLNEDLERYTNAESQGSSAIAGIAKGKIEYAQRLLAHIQLMKHKSSV
jgi:hypothetical protein